MDTILTPPSLPPAPIQGSFFPPNDLEGALVDVADTVREGRAPLAVLQGPVTRVCAAMQAQGATAEEVIAAIKRAVSDPLVDPLPAGGAHLTLDLVVAQCIKWTSAVLADPA